MKKPGICLLEPKYQTLARISIICLLLLTKHVSSCPAGCTCSVKKNQNPPERRVLCKTNTPFTSVDQLPPEKIPIDTVQLDLSENAIGELPAKAFATLGVLKKLDLSDNQISVIHPEAFQGLKSLEKLNLANNKIGVLNHTVFKELKKLERISLSGNPLKTLPETIFDGLTSLSRVDFASELLVCDCKLDWVPRWLRTTDVRLSATTTCTIPKRLKGLSLKGIAKADLHCNWPVELPVFELYPEKSQVVFEGDKLPFRCHASVVDVDTRIVWYRNGNAISSNSSRDIYIQTEQQPDQSSLTSHLVLNALDVDDTGIWKCVVLTSRGNVTRGVNLVVIPQTSYSCPGQVIQTNRGVFDWPKTVGGVKVERDCPQGASTSYRQIESINPPPPRASRFCNDVGVWQQANLEQCQFESQVTRVLEEYAKADMANLTKVLTRADELQNYVKNPDLLTNVMDVVFLAQIVEGLAKQTNITQKVGDVILSIAAMLMKANRELLNEAQYKEKSCTRVVDALNHLPTHILKVRDLRDSLTLTNDNITSLAFRIEKPSEFPGIVCFTQKPNVKVDTKREMYTRSKMVCSQQTNFTLSDDLKKDFATVTYIPGSVLQDRATVECHASDDNSTDTNSTCLRDSNATYWLQFTMFSSDAFFPVIHNQNIVSGSQIETSVFSSDLVNETVQNLTEPITISMSVNTTNGLVKPVFWSTTANNGTGGWSSEGCWITQLSDLRLTFQCNHMTNFAVLKSPLPVYEETWYKEILSLHPAVYGGSAFLILCALLVVFTYACSPWLLQMPSKNKHAIANLCLSLLLLCLTFTFGIHLRSVELVCQGVGISLHYFSLCVLFWVLINAYNLYRKFTAWERPKELMVDGMETPIPPRPMLRFYLIGWGISLIIVGITAAVNHKVYSDGKAYCFLSFEPSLGAFLIPVGILIFINILFFLRICCLLHTTPDYPRPQDEPETEEINDLEMTEEIESIPRDTNSAVSVKTGEYDLEYRPICQLRAITFFLLIYLLTWGCAAFIVAKPFYELVPYYDYIFTYAYVSLCGILGLFLFVFFVLARSDARGSWVACKCCCSPKPRDKGNSLQTNGNGKNTQPHKYMNGSARHYTSDNSDLTSKSNSRHKNYQPSQSDPSVISGTVQEYNFYNPKQNGVAKKYWEKKHRKRSLNMLHNRNSYNDSDFLVNDVKGSEANTHLSIEIQIQSQPKNRSSQSPKATNTEKEPLIQASPKNNEQMALLGGGSHSLSFNPDTSVMGRTSPSGTTGSSQQPNSYAFGIPAFLPGPSGLSAHELGSSYPAMVHTSGSSKRHSSYNRPRDFDGQSHTSGAFSGYNSDVANMDPCRQPAPSQVNHQRQYGSGSDIPQNNSSDPKNLNELPPSHSSNKVHKDSFLDMLEQRIPSSNSLERGQGDRNSAHSRGDRNSAHSLNSANSSNRTQSAICDETIAETSEDSSDHIYSVIHNTPVNQPAVSSQVPLSVNGDINSYIRPHRKRTKSQKSWDEHFRDRPKKSSYCYINHDYTKRVVNKVIQQNENGIIDPVSQGMTWFPRSISAYDQVTSDAGSSHLEMDDVDSVSSSSDDSLDNDIWMVQKNKCKKQKKETSV